MEQNLRPQFIFGFLQVEGLKLCYRPHRDSCLELAQKMGSSQLTVGARTLAAKVGLAFSG